MDTRQSEKKCDCTISNQNPNCTGEHARNLSDAARYMLNAGDSVEPPRRARTPNRSRDRELVDEPLEYIDPPLPERRYVRYESSGESEIGHAMQDMFNTNRGQIQQTLRRNEPAPLFDSSGRELVNPGGNLVEDSRFRAVNRDPLSKFQSLRIGESSLREVSIGGFKIDMEAAASKAQEVVPLPPARLPVIFASQDLNFYHHFFNGIYEIITYDDLMDVICSEPCESSDSNFVVNTIEELLALGYEKSDSEAMNLIKRMLQSTFKVETTKHRSSRERSSSLFVEANLWGFPYLESTMTCKEIDMRYWLQACYESYKTEWFNTFKSTKMPMFARSVSKKTRGGSSSSSKPSLSSISEVSDHEIANMLRNDVIPDSSVLRDNVSVISRSSHRRRRPSRRSSSDSEGQRMVKSWFA